MADSEKLAAGEFTTRHPIEADYLIIGAGAVGMAFADTLLSETQATIALVDRRHRPGGPRWRRVAGPSILAFFLVFLVIFVPWQYPRKWKIC